jgi:L-rhamnose mutarotase
MTRRAFTMRLKPNALVEYKQHHDNIWPELVDEIERAGIASITTFQRDDDLFLVSEIADEAAWDRLWTSEVHRRWAELMQPLMNMRDDGIVEAHDLIEIFHVTTGGNGQSPSAILAVAEPASKAGETRSGARAKAKKSGAKKRRAVPKKAAMKAKPVATTMRGGKKKQTAKKAVEKAVNKKVAKRPSSKQKAVKKSVGKKKRK